MAEFISEIRSRPRSLWNLTTDLMPEGFVSEIRPRSQDALDCKGSLDSSDEELKNVLSGRSFTRESMTNILEGAVITLVEKLLTGHPIGRIEGQIVVSLYGSEYPLVVDIHKLFHNSMTRSFDPVTDLDCGLNVKIRNRSPSTLETPEDGTFSTSPLSIVSHKDYCPSVGSLSSKGSSSPPCLSIGYHSDTDLSSPQHDEGSNPSALSPCPELVDDETATNECSLKNSSTETQRRRESDEESGYTSSEVNDHDLTSSNSEDSSDSDDAILQPTRRSYNDYFCSGFDGKDRVYIPDVSEVELRSSDDALLVSEDKIEDMDDRDDVDCEIPLVIDDMKQADVRETQEDGSEEIESMDLESHGHDGRTTDADLKDDIVNPSHLYAEEAKCCKMADRARSQSPPSPDSADIDLEPRVDLSGNGEMSLGVWSPLATSDIPAVKHCCKAFNAKSSLKRIARHHAGIRSHNCSQCTQTLARVDERKNHLPRHDCSKQNRYSSSKKIFSARACVKTHKVKEHRSRVRYVCPLCGEGFTYDNDFSVHKKSHPELRQFSCKICTFVGTTDLKAQKHALIHSRKLFSCKPCNAYFADPFDYTDHLSTHKKDDSFSQYVCCFCDKALGTYDRLLRHEDSHAQGKIHTCKVCKKQFKSKSLLSDHSLCHNKNVAEKPQVTNNMFQEYAIVKPLPASTHAPSCDLHIPDSGSFDPKFTSLSTLSWEEASSKYLPKTNTITPMAPQSESDEFHGELLDLSMKKPSSPNYSSSVYENQEASGRSISCQKPLGLIGKCAPRNGCATEAFCLRQESEVGQRAFSSYRSMEEHVFTGRECSNSSDDAMSRESYAARIPTYLRSADVIEPNSGCFIYHSPLTQIRPQSVERCPFPARGLVDGPERRTLGRSISGVHHSKSSLRFSPCTRDKMADLVAKFKVARGPKLIVQKVHNKPGINRDKEIDLSKQLPQLPALISKWQLQEDAALVIGCKENLNKENAAGALRGKQENSTRGSIMPRLCGHDDNDRSREDSNSETALRCPRPAFVVKSEPLAEVDMAAGMLPSNDFTDAKGEDFHCTSGPSIERNHACELCKVKFGSFSDLEAHSVDLHKRYLCEHCGKSFTARPNRDRHVRYHTGERPYKCDLCELAFFRGDDLKYHRTTRHPTAQPFTCPRCSASFTWGRDLERHIRHSKCKA